MFFIRIYDFSGGGEEKLMFFIYFSVFSKLDYINLKGKFVYFILK